MSKTYTKKPRFNYDILKKGGVHRKQRGSERAALKRRLVDRLDQCLDEVHADLIGSDIKHTE